jgi:hypothetical protein
MSAVIEDRNRRIYPPSLQPPGGEHVTARQLLRPVAFAGTTENSVRTDLTYRTGRPLVHLTFGTVVNDKEAFRAAVTGIGDPRAQGDSCVAKASARPEWDRRTRAIVGFAASKVGPGQIGRVQVVCSA